MDSSNKAEIQSLLVRARALRDALMFVYNTDHNNIWRFSSYLTFMREYNELAEALGKLSYTGGTLKIFNLSKIKGQYDTLAMAQKSYCDSTLAMLSMLISVAEQELGAQASELQGLL